MPGYPSLEQNVLHLPTLSDVVDDHERPTPALLINDDSNVQHVSAEVVGHQVTGIVGAGVLGQR